jgi:hypothetical protein
VVTHKTTGEETPEVTNVDEEPAKKPLTAKALLESGVVGLWKDRTDIGDSVEYARTLREQAGERRRERLRKHIQS